MPAMPKIKSPESHVRDRIAVLACCTSRTVQNYFKAPDRMKPRVRARVESALRTIDMLGPQQMGVMA